MNATEHEINVLLWKLECYLKLKMEKEEMDIINRVQDPEQQGYLSAPLICKVTGATPELVMAATLEAGQVGEVDAKRNAGVIRWCKQQMRHGLRVVQ